MKNARKWLLTFLILTLMIAAFWWQWWQKQQSLLPDGIASGNGRIEANEVDIATKYAGRIQDIFADEGDLVKTGQVLAQMDTNELQTQYDRVKANLAQSQETINEAKAKLEKSRRDLAYTEKQSRRIEAMLKKGLTTQSLADEQRNALASARAQIKISEANLKALEKSKEAYQASVRQIQAELNESILKAPVTGRVLYRLAQKGEVLGGGGKIMTLLDLSNIYMEIFLPAKDAGVLKIGDDARIVLDIYPNQPIPAKVTFVSPQAQFTPKQVETKDERDKLMFRVKLQIPPSLVRQHIQRVKTGLRGVGYVKTREKASWPAYLNGSLTESQG
ncbi:MAG: efflux RND transporter periplasmic adaptor subunit [Hydrogenovibrio sp.]|nr:efflux RND transporter periplasmic adaptor subunit [Hydrogenovibrio sp.]